jgi:hypothetical protein
MKALVLRSWFLLLYFELIMLARPFRDLHATVQNQRVRGKAPDDASSAETLCHAMDFACVFYFKRVLCLQRSAATTLLLRRHGFAAEMVIGAQMLPFRSHAWVEIDQLTVSDKPYMREIYQVLERC